MLYSVLTPTSELDAVNTILSGIGEAPVSSLGNSTSDVSLARRILDEVCKDMQLEGFGWNTEDDFPLTVDAAGEIPLPPAVLRVHFREPTHLDLTVRKDRVYDRARHSFVFEPGTRLLVTLTFLLPFDTLPEAARRYATIKALRVFQERVLGSRTLSAFQKQDEARARVALMADERKQDRPNILAGTLQGFASWRLATALGRPR